ncbi:MAG TPA: GNAT family N-acetyltransferase [Phenylobacterium sp.]|nr:GNAT family N-acetyltransferase [Phenylobacterium sp.]
MSQPLIRRAGSADAEALATIGAATFVETFGHLYPAADLEAFLLHAYGLDRIRADLADPAKASWIVEAGGQAVGYALAGPCGLPHPLARPDDGEVNRLYLLKAWQNGGTGGRLFDALEAWLQKDGPRVIWIGVWSGNHGAQRFYARRGFGRVGDYEFAVGNTLDHEYILRRRR